MGRKIEKIDEAYFAKTEGNSTLSGIPLKKVYGPEDASPRNYRVPRLPRVIIKVMKRRE